MITIFKDYIVENNDIFANDNRKFSEYVKCIKDYKKKHSHFEKDKYYKIEGIQGDVERAIDDGLDYTPVKYTSAVYIMNNNNLVPFKIQNTKYRINNQLPDFFKYFELPEYVKDMEKYNL